LRSASFAPGIRSTAVAKRQHRDGD